MHDTAMWIRIKCNTNHGKDQTSFSYTLRCFEQVAVAVTLFLEARTALQHIHLQDDQEHC